MADRVSAMHDMAALALKGEGGGMSKGGAGLCVFLGPHLQTATVLNFHNFFLLSIHSLMSARS